ncbi:addiction module protein [Limnohabitans sp.]|jgi:hypothetical protein
MMSSRIKKFLDQTSPLSSAEKDAMIDEALDGRGKSLDTLWAIEAESRLTAYQSGKVKAIPLEDVLTKYPN